jgi:hypothetical protein
MVELIGSQINILKFKIFEVEVAIEFEIKKFIEAEATNSTLNLAQEY